MDKLNKIILVQLGILVLYSGLEYLRDDSYAILGVAIWMVAHIFISILAGVVLLAKPEDRSYGKALLISAGIVLVVGFPSCWALFN